MEVEGEDSNVEELAQHKFGEVEVVLSLDIIEVSHKFICHLLPLCLI